MVYAAGIVSKERRGGDSYDAFDKGIGLLIISSTRESKSDKESQYLGHRDACGKGKHWKEVCPTLQGG